MSLFLVPCCAKMFRGWLKVESNAVSGSVSISIDCLGGALTQWHLRKLLAVPDCIA